MEDLEVLRAGHPGWTVDRRRDGLIVCVTGKHTLYARGVAEAGRGMWEWDTQTGLTADEFIARVTG